MFGEDEEQRVVLEVLFVDGVDVIAHRLFDGGGMAVEGSKRGELRGPVMQAHVWPFDGLVVRKVDNVLVWKIGVDRI